MEDVRKKIAELLANRYGHPLGYCNDAFYKEADEILNLKYEDGSPMIAILDKDQEVPHFYTHKVLALRDELGTRVGDRIKYDGHLLAMESIKMAQQDMVSQGWRKVVNDGSTLSQVRLH